MTILIYCFVWTSILFYLAFKFDLIMVTCLWWLFDCDKEKNNINTFWKVFKKKQLLIEPKANLLVTKFPLAFDHPTCSIHRCQLNKIKSGRSPTFDPKKVVQSRDLPIKSQKCIKHPKCSTKIG